MTNFVNSFSIIPIIKSSKKPLFDWKPFQLRQPSLEEVEQWKKNWPDCNWALVTGKVSGVVVLDADSQQAYEYAQKCGLPRSPIVKTGRGYHIYFKYREGVRCLQSVAGRKDIQLKADGGYILIPPSLHPSGATYRWLGGFSFDDIPLAEIPQWVVESQQTKDQVSLAELYKGVVEGGRNGALARLTGSWVNDGMPLAEAVEFAHLWNESKNSPPLSDDEVKRTVESIYRGHFERHPESSIQISLERLPLIRVADIKVKPLEFLIKDIWVEQSVGYISGQPGVCKTWFVWEMALAVAAGVPFLGKYDTKKSRVIAFNAEDDPAHGTRSRLQALCVGKNLDLDDLDIFLINVPSLQMNDKKTQEAFELTLAENQPGLVILDPLRNVHSLNEDSATEMTAGLLRYLREINRKYLCSIVLVCHDRKPSNNKGSNVHRGAEVRGSGALTGWRDNAIYLDKRKEGLIEVQVYNKYSQQTDPFCFRLITQKGNNAVLEQALLRETTKSQVNFEKDLKLSDDIKRILSENPGISGNQICEYIRGKKQNCTDTIRFLKDEGSIVEKGRGKLYIVGEGTDKDDSL